MEEQETKPAKKSNLRIILFIPIAIIALALFVTLRHKSPPSVDVDIPHTQNGPMAPDFSLPDLDGRMVNLSSYKGRVVIVNIWATWCPPCVAEAPSLDKLYKIFKEEGLELLAVSVDKDGKRAVEPFMKKKNLSFPVLLDPDGRVAGLYRTRGVPESFIVKKDGTIDNKIEGAIDWTSPKVIEYFQKLLKE
ncbi:MAG: TlpA family protein disulfide reductase [Deltaproteobacteria bacterium]|nr:TlpA family protein disulfide reductase [Deltaproteobacteria bacterium]